MNLELLESFGQNYPEEADGTLDCISMALTCTFNRWGTLLAVGCNDGRIVIWDFLTRGIAKIISAHIHPVCSLCWSRDGHKLVSASTDNMVSLWDVLSGDCDQRFRFPSPILKVQFHPRDHTITIKVQAYLLMSCLTFLKSEAFHRTTREHLNVLELCNGVRPERLPIFDEECWKLMEACWNGDQSQRPLLGIVQPMLQGIMDRLCNTKVSGKTLEDST
ncbi:retinoblastoma-binding protein 5-like [Pelobates fuscus]|uniref:retinoblastoma-binding protein 5-like n=1 Tax=Pelobates fuscus TaxID=191477 RepID=UPI002FE4F982